jgi:hypothetical protein
MDEASWLRCDEPQVLLDWLRAGDRKLPPTPASSGASAVPARTTGGASRSTR